MNYYYSDHNYGHEEADDAEPSTSHPSQSDTKGYSYCSDLTNEFALDGEIGSEIGTRLYQMIPIPHVPRINGEIPSIDEVISDHQRLLDSGLIVVAALFFVLRLQMYDFVEHKVQGDGNCQFHQFVRQQVVNQLRSHPAIYGGYVPMEYGDYSEKMSEY
ncbi:OVARIAN TUMOR DOMAIN-containing deubiquitinating enzyme 9-like [Carya illinoinensis]|uniref:OVARIAN TUMOR DOMAIN-containing deubiquitinating enzyme 9-like n=1 Tax=Carya illinoinensis TaxID=32201 RepID=UPI001C71A03B|nr:OVARIAN TUMOR DOMAIN-containing deubiquitinating enzyme 9-like [Carya illinoinensis]